MQKSRRKRQNYGAKYHFATNVDSLVINKERKKVEKGFVEDFLFCITLKIISKKK